MAEGGMSDVVDKSERFRKIGVKAKGRGNGARNLRDLQCVRQAVAKVVGIASGEDLCFSFQAAKGARVHNAVAVARVSATVRMGRLGKAPPARNLFAHGPRRKMGERFDRPHLPVPEGPAK